MPEPLRSDAPPRNPQYPQGAEHEDFSRASHDQQPHLYGALPRSRAENLGRTVGSAVSGVLRFPQHASSRIRQAGQNTRAQASAVVLDMMDTAAQRAENLRRTTGAALSDWARSTRSRAAQLEKQAAERWEDLRFSAKEPLEHAGSQVVERWKQTQQAVSRVKEEDPARFLMMVAGAAFLVGVGLRIWRSGSND